jgi:queuine tRNA-ribosyltransferase
LFKAGEVLGLTLNTIHNLSYTVGLTQAARAAISNGTLPEFAQTTRQLWQMEDTK